MQNKPNGSSLMTPMANLSTKNSTGSATTTLSRSSMSSSGRTSRTTLKKGNFHQLDSNKEEANAIDKFDVLL
eukprot:9504348-Ditylum_brightwellii.AAC.1